MSSKLNRHAYQEMIDGDVAALVRDMPDNLERRHIENILKDSVRVYYDCPHCSALAEGRETTPPEALRSGETPRTDALQEKIRAMHYSNGTFPSEGMTEITEHARQLERELVDEIRTVDALQKEIERLLSIPSPRGKL